MNVNTHNNMAMMYSMVGLPQGSQAPRLTSRTLDTGSQVTQKEKSDESKDSQTERFFPEFQKATQNNKSESELSGTGRRYVGEEIPSQDDGKSTREKSFDLSNSPKTLDTSRQIQYKFQSLNNFMSKGASSSEENPGTKRQRHTASLKQWVDLEYKQYVKAPDTPYKKRDLREIMNALNSKDMPRSESLTSLGSGSGSTSEAPPNTNFNLLNLTKVARTMNFLEDPLPQVQQDSQYL
ncbi:MAG: hypothetical protein AB2L14_21360 [Candidatus Xenobiia bacterium LiM19]